jgi:polysaccharide biosynthesis transport protein
MPSLGLVPLLFGSTGRKISGQQQDHKESLIFRFFPRLRRGGRNNPEAENMDLIVYQQPKSMVTEAIRQIYSSIMLSTSGRPPVTIMVTSPNPGDGKTTIVSNLAQSYALDDRQVVLIDCDLRKPKIHHIYKLDLQPGLSNYLTGNATLEKILKPTEVPNLTVITSGARPPQPANLLNSETFKELIALLRERFHHVIIDTPPVLGFADARFVSTQMDGILLVTRQNVTQKSAGRLAQQFLNQGHLLGTVLNAVGSHMKRYGGYYYQYNYNYYSKYYGDKDN